MVISDKSPLMLFQFTHPGRGATITLPQGYPTGRSFNSRTPGGVRLSTRYIRKPALSFNSRTPGGVRHTINFLNEMDYKFQFTHPGRGATRHELTIYTSKTSFNSRTPGGVRQCGAKLRIMGRINKRNLRLAVLL